MLSILDNDVRLADHFRGRQHVGMINIRRKLKELVEVRSTAFAFSGGEGDDQCPHIHASSSTFFIIINIRSTMCTRSKVSQPVSPCWLPLRKLQAGADRAGPRAGDARGDDRRTSRDRDDDRRGPSRDREPPRDRDR